jgi:hypothetical protein
MDCISAKELAVIWARKRALAVAIQRKRSPRWLLRLWSQFIRARDAFRCLSCETSEGIQAHHIIRKTLYPWGALELGNGVTLCPECHRRIHEKFNGRPDLSLPLGAEEGDDQDEWAFLFGLLCDDAVRRGLPERDFYHLDDHVLEFSVRCQGYQDLREAVLRGEVSRIRFAHEIWRRMPEGSYSSFVSELIRLNLSDRPH